MVDFFPPLPGAEGGENPNACCGFHGELSLPLHPTKREKEPRTKNIDSSCKKKKPLPRNSPGTVGPKAMNPSLRLFAKLQKQSTGLFYVLQFAIPPKTQRSCLHQSAFDGVAVRHFFRAKGCRQRLPSAQIPVFFLPNQRQSASLKYKWLKMTG